MISAHIIGHPLACRLQTAAKIILFSELPRLHVKEKGKTCIHPQQKASTYSLEEPFIASPRPTLASIVGLLNKKRVVRVIATRTTLRV